MAMILSVVDKEDLHHNEYSSTNDHPRCDDFDDFLEPLKIFEKCSDNVVYSCLVPITGTDPL